MRGNLKRRIRYIAIILMLTFVVTNINISSMLVKAEEQEEERYILYELEDKRTENQKFYLNSDGTETIRTYTEDIHYFDGEKFEEINECLEKVETEEGQVYKTISNDLNISMPEELSQDDGINISSEDDKDIEMMPLINEEIDVNSSREVDSNEDNTLTIEDTIKEAAISGEDVNRNLSKEINEYNKLIYKYDEDIKISYNTLKNGIKEEFILNTCPKNNTFTTKIKLDGYKLELKEEYNRVDIIDIETGKIEGVMPQPLVYDSSEEVNETLNAIYSVKDLGNYEYLVTITVDNEFLEDSSTKYPVYVDPTYTRVVNKNNHTSSYVMSGYPNWNFIGNNSMPVGYYNSKQKLSRTYVTVDVPVKSNEIVISAKYKIFSKGGSSSKGGGNFSLYAVNSSWNPATITWNNKPSHGEKVSTKNLQSLSGEWVTFDLTKFATLFKKGKANSFVMIADNEGGTYRNFASEYYQGYEPYVEVVVGSFSSAPTAKVAAGAVNSSKGSVNISWQKIEGVKGYKIGIFNGVNYEWIDVGNVTSYNTKGKGIWPTVAEIQNGRKTIKKDGKGQDLADDPSNLYKNNSNSTHKNDKYYYFKVKAYNAYGDESTESSVVKVKLPDRTKPRPVTNFSGSVNNSAINVSNSGSVNLSWTARGSTRYKTYVEGEGWQVDKYNSDVSGTERQAKRLEAIQISLKDVPNGIGVKYQVHMQDSGWDKTWRSNGATAGSPGSGKRLEAIKIQLTGDTFGYDIQYRAHIQGKGWDDWKKNGEIAGTVGESKRLEAIQIKLVAKTTNYKIEQRKAPLETGVWSGYTVINDAVSGTTGKYTINNLKDSYKYQFRIIAYDSQWNYSDPVVTDELIVEDRTAPNVGEIKYDKNYTANDSIEVSFNNLYDVSGISNIQFKVEGKDSIYKSFSCDARKVNIDLSGMTSKDITVRYKFTDKFKNYKEGSFIVKRDIDVPIAKLNPVGLQQGSYFTGIMAIDFSAEDSRSGIKEWKLYVQENVIGNTTKTIIDSGKSAVNKIISFDTDKLIDNKTYKLVLESYDVSGNKSVKEFLFIKKARVENLSKTFNISMPEKVTESSISVNYDSDNVGSLYLYNIKTKELVRHAKANKAGQGLILDSLSLEEGQSYYVYVNGVNNGKIGYSKNYYQGEVLNDEFYHLKNIRAIKNLSLQKDKLVIDSIDNPGLIYTKSAKFDFFVDAVELKVKQVQKTKAKVELYIIENGTGKNIKLNNENGIYRLPEATKVLNLIVKITSVDNVKAEIDNLEINAYGAFLEESAGGELITINLVDQPEIISVKSNLDYKTKIIWNPSETSGVKYNVYRGTSKDFTISDENKIADEIEGNSFSDYNLNYGETFYYKVTAVKYFGGVKRESVPSTQEAKAVVVDKNEIYKNVGKQDYYDFVDFETAEGNGGINVNNKNLVYEYSDLIIDSPCLSMVLRRTYNSLSNTTSSFGQNFDFSFNTLLFKEYVDGNEVAMLLKDGDGTVHRFEKLNDGTYKRPKGVFIDILLDSNTKRYKVIKDDGIIYNFDEQLRLREFRDKNNNYLSLDYNNIGEISKITNNVGDSIQLSYNEKGFIKEAKTSSNIIYYYSYDNNNRLIEVKTYVDNKKDSATTRIIKYSYGNSGDRFVVTDAKKNVSEVLLENKEVKKVIYPNKEFFEVISNNNTRTIKDQSGKEFKYILNSEGLVLETINEIGKSIKYEYNSNYQVIKETSINNGIEVTTNYNYNNNGKLLKVVDANKNWSEVKYNDKGDPIEFSIPLLNENNLSKINIEYDSNRNVISETDSLNRSSKYSYNKRGQVISSTDIFGNKTTYNYDSKGRMISELDSLGRKSVEILKYDKYGNPIEYTDKTGLKQVEKYNSLGELTYFKDVDGYSETYYYDKNSNLISVVDSRGRQTEYKYDNLDRLILIKYPDNSTEEYIYDRDESTGNDIVIMIDGDKVETKIYYDSLGREWKKTVGGIQVLENKYDDAGNLVEVIDGEGKETKAEYDILGRQTSITVDPKGLNIRQQIEYDKFGKINKITESTGVILTYEYDKLGRIIKEEEDNGIEKRTTKYKFDEIIDGKVRNTTIDSLGRKSEVYYDNIGRVEKEVVYGDKGNTKKLETKYTYNSKFDLVESILFQDGTSQKLSYNKYGQLTETKYMKKDGSVDTISKFVYDDNGNLKSTENTTGEMSVMNNYSYDIMDKIIQKVQGNQIINYEYSAADRVIQISYPEEDNKDRLNKIQYNYDDAGRLSQVKFDGKVVNEYLYTNGTQIDKVKYYNKFDSGSSEFIEIDYSYNSIGSPELVTYKKNGKEIKEKQEISYAKNTGYIEKETYTEYYSNKENKVDKTYEYNSDGRLKKSTSKNGSTSYYYDILGNKLKEVQEEKKDGKITKTTLDYQYGDFDRLLSIKKNAGDYINYTYDELGNTLSQVEKTSDATGKNITLTTNYSYNLRNELTKVTVSDGKNKSVTENYYDVDGQRVKKVEDKLVTNYMYVGDSVLYTTDNKGNKATENILDPSGGIVATKRFDGNYANKYFKYTYDARGSIISILDPDVKRVKGYGYDDFGNTTEVGDNNFINEVKYGGMIEDEASGLHYMNARHYNPTSGRFLTEDTYNDPMSTDLYSYTGNNPINYVDPTGHYSSGGVASLIEEFLIEALDEGLGLAVKTLARVAPLCLYVEVDHSKLNEYIGEYIQINSYNANYSISSKVYSTPIKSFSSTQIKPLSSIGGHLNHVFSSNGYAVDNTTTFPGEIYVEPLLNGIPKSQEVQRVIDNVARIQEKAKENAKVAEGEGEAESVGNTVEDVLRGAKDTTRMKGKARNLEKSGGYEKALDDFNSLNPRDTKDIKTKYGNGKFGRLKDGTNISVRPGSNTGGATLEIKIPGQRLIKVRY